MTQRRRYSPWDGTQVGFDLDSLSLIDQIAEDVTYHGDIQAALRRLMYEGMTDASGNRLEGLRSMLERLRAQRAEFLENNSMGSMLGDVGERLQEILDAERSYMDRQEQAAFASGDDDWFQQAVDAFSPRRMDLDLLPADLPGQLRSLDEYSFANPESQAAFDELVGDLREQLIGNTFNQMAGAMRDMTPADMARMKDMFEALNEMIENHNAGRDVDFDGFMERFGDMFPEQPESLEELLDVMARRMAAMQALMNSMSPEQRAELEALSAALMSDMDLQWQMNQLSANLQEMFPDLGWAQRYQMGEGQPGADPLDLVSGSELMRILGELDSLEQALRSAAAPGALDEIDLDVVREMLGEDAARSLSELAQMQRRLEADGLINRQDGAQELTPEGLRRIGQAALAHVFKHLDPSKVGRHDRPAEGIGHERSFVTKPFEFGDPFNLDIQRTLRNAIVRNGRASNGGPDASHGSRPGRVQLSADDFEIETTEQSVRCATVLMIDLSMSMHLRHYFSAAKRTAVALHALISSQFPNDFLGIVGFASSASIVKPQDLPKLSWDMAYGTNMQHGLMLARAMLARQRGTRQIMMITDGEPTSFIDPETGQSHFQYPPPKFIEDLTLVEVNRCTKSNIRINTFMLEPDASLQRFVTTMTGINKGRAFYATPGNLDDFVLVDFLEQRRTLIRGRRAS